MKKILSSILILMSISGFAYATNTVVTALPATSAITESPAIQVGNLVFISGQGGGSATTSNDTAAAIRESLQEIRDIATQMGGDLNDIVKLDVYLANIQDYPILNSVMGEYFHEPYPTRTTVGANIPKNHTVEIDAVMVLKK